MEELTDLKELVGNYLDLIFKVGLVLVILSTFFLFTNFTTEYFDIPKFLVLIIFTGILLVLLMLKFTLTGKVVFIRSPLDIPWLLLLAVGIVSTILSSSPYASLLGNQLRINGSLVTIIVYVLFYFLLVNNLKNFKEIRILLGFILIASQILAVISLLTYFGINILPPWATAALTTTGSAFSTTAVLALLVPFIVARIFKSRKSPFLITNSIFLFISGLTIALTGTWATWIAAIFGIIFAVLVFGPIKQIEEIINFKNPNWQSMAMNAVAFVSPLILIAFIVILSFIPPLGKAKNPLYTRAQSFPREFQLSLIPSWKISVSAFRDSPFWGTGPATYLFDFTNYKPIEFNSSKAWNLRFDSSFNEYLQTLATLGGIGILALLSLTALFVSSSGSILIKSLLRPHFAIEQTRSDLHILELKQTLAISGLIFFIILALHVSSLVVWVTGILIIASFMVLNLSDSLQKSWSTAGKDFKTAFFQIAANVTAHNPSEETIKIDALPGVLLAVSLGLSLFVGFFGGKIIVADYHHRLALNAVSRNDGITAYNELIAAEKLNPRNDTYRTDLAQVNFALANAIAVAKGPTEASPTGTLTDQDKQNIQVLLSQSITEGRTAVTLSPKSAINWEILAILYRQISGVAQNALLFSLDSYGRAIIQDPLNPTLRVNVGGVYYAVRNYDMSIRFFTDAINLKPDYANGYFNLSVALRDKGDLNSAQAAAEKLLTILDKNSQDYKTASAYLDDLKAKIASGSSQTSDQSAQTPAQPPAAQPKEALEEKNLPKVINLPKPANIATPAAIKKPETSPTPAPTSSPAELTEPTPTPSANP